MKALPIISFTLVLFASTSISACDTSEAQEQEGHGEEHHEAQHKLVVTNPVAKDVISTQQYVCQIHSRRHIEVRAIETGYLQEVRVQEGQAVEMGDVMFKIVP